MNQVVLVDVILRYENKVMGIGKIEERVVISVLEDIHEHTTLMEFLAVLVPDGGNYVEVYELPRLCSPRASDGRGVFNVSAGGVLDKESEAYRMIRRAIVMYAEPGTQPGRVRVEVELAGHSVNE